jgi:hypothetical protein
MAQTVAIFNLYHGTELTEAQGWHLLQILKDVRLFTRPGYHADSAEDCVAYAALKAEALAAADIANGYAELLDKSSALHVSLKGVAESFLAEQAGDGWTPEAVKASAFPKEWPDESRRQDAAAEDEAFAAVASKGAEKSAIPNLPRKAFGADVAFPTERGLYFAPVAAECDDA